MCTDAPCVAIRTQQPTKMSATSREIAVGPPSPRTDRQTQRFRIRIHLRVYHIPICTYAESGNRVGNSICATRYSPICRIAVDRFRKKDERKKIIPSTSRVISFSFRANSFASCPKANSNRMMPRRSSFHRFLLHV